MNRKECLTMALTMVFTAFLGGLISAGIFSAKTTLAEKEAISADRFRLLDKDGNVRALLTTVGEDEQPRLVFFDQQRRPRAKLAVGLSGDPFLMLWDEGGKIRVTLRLKDGDPSVVLSDRKEEARVLIGLEKNGQPSWTLK